MRVVFIIIVLLFSMCGVYSRKHVCKNIKNRYSPKKIQINVPVAPKPYSRVLLYWGSDPSRAAAALFAVIIQDALGYDQVTVRYGRHRLNDLINYAKLLPYPNDWRLYKEIAIILSTAWEPSPISESKDEVHPSVAGPRLQDFGLSEIPTRLQLHVFLADKVVSECVNITRRWTWYMDISGLPHCGFGNLTLSDDHLTVYGLNPNERNMTGTLAVNERVNLPRFRFNKLSDRKTLVRMINTSNQSFLFIDYELWTDYDNIHTIEVSPCVNRTAIQCLMEPNTKALRLADVSLLENYAPRLLQLAYNFKPALKSIREILDMEKIQEGLSVDMISKNTVRVACEWASNNTNIVDKWVQKYYTQTYKIAVFHCADDPDFEEYDKLLAILRDDIKELRENNSCSIELIMYKANCSDINYLKVELNTQLTSELVGGLMGVIVGGLKGIAEAAKLISWANLPMILYKEDPLHIELPEMVWMSARSSLYLAIALHHFISRMNWTRIVVLSEDTVAANDFVQNVANFDNVVLRNYILPSNLTQLNAENVLRDLQDANAHIVFVNTNPGDASTILSVAQDLGMSSSTNYAWITRERLPHNETIKIKHFTISSYSQSKDVILNTDGRSDLREKVYNLWPNRTWPTHAVSLVDAVLTIINGFKSAMLKFPRVWDDVRENAFIRLMKTSFTEESIKGLIQNLTYKNRSLEEILVFVDEWPDHQHRYKARWRINTTAKTVHVEYEQRTPYYGSSQPHDGASICYARSGDPFLPTCYDAFWQSALIGIILAIVFAFFRYIRHGGPKQQTNDVEMLPIYKHKFTHQSDCKGYLVKKTALKISQKVGKGQFRCDRLAILHVGGHTETVVLKALCKHHVDFGALREAYILTSLKHDHIIRLVGVCFDDEPPLVLMEVAFFGDLLLYLQSRRYLVAGVTSEVEVAEAVHISAKALTTFARQAASALDYLSARGVIHHDLRASNCLVDANRCLKLAGFCMATENESDTEIPCIQRELMSLQGMAPESFRGNFSVASDIWAFGVLVFELVTLGAKPYGDMSSLVIEEFVTKGGTPQMPDDASLLTNELVQMCWRRDPKERVTAAEVEDFLTRKPTALSPAIGYEEVVS